MQTADDGLRIESIHLDGHAVLAVHGEIDLATAEEFETAIKEGLAGHGKVILDFSDVTFMDSSGLNVLVAAAEQNGGGESVLIRNPPVSVRRLLSITGLDAVIPIEGDADQPPQSVI